MTWQDWEANVPRCGNCRHWHPRHDDDAFGECKLANRSESYAHWCPEHKHHDQYRK